MSPGHLSRTGQVHPGPASACRACRSGASRPELNTAAWQRTRTLVRARDRNRCRICGTTEKLSVHHIRQGAGDSLDNLVTLCRRHHEQAERVGFLEANRSHTPADFGEKDGKTR